MKAATLPLGFLLLTASAHGGPFRGRDDCAPGTRNSRAETEAEVCRARRLASLSCAGLAAHAEVERLAANLAFSARYNRPTAAAVRYPAPVPAPASPVRGAAPVEPPAPAPESPPVFAPPGSR